MTKLTPSRVRRMVRIGPREASRAARALEAYADETAGIPVKDHATFLLRQEATATIVACDAELRRHGKQSWDPKVFRTETLGHTAPKTRATPRQSRSTRARRAAGPRSGSDPGDPHPDDEPPSTQGDQP